MDCVFVLVCLCYSVFVCLLVSVCLLCLFVCLFASVCLIDFVYLLRLFVSIYFCLPVFACLCVFNSFFSFCFNLFLFVCKCLSLCFCVLRGNQWELVLISCFYVPYLILSFKMFCLMFSSKLPKEVIGGNAQMFVLSSRGEKEILAKNAAFTL